MQAMHRRRALSGDFIISAIIFVIAVAAAARITRRFWG
jgi:hypothetical protein